MGKLFRIRQRPQARSAGSASAALDAAVSTIAKAPKGSRNNALYCAARDVSAFVAAETLTEETVRTRLKEACVANELMADDGVESIENTITSALSASEPRTEDSMGKEAGIPAAWAAWKDKLTRTGNDSVARNVQNLVTIFTHADEWVGVFGFNERMSRIVLLKPPPIDDDFPDFMKHSGDLRDPHAIWIATWLARNCPIVPSVEMVFSAIQAVAHGNSFDPVRDYLTGLAWDSVPRVDGWACNYLGSDDTPYVRAVAAKWMISAVARAFKPGCKSDCVIVLEGEQGVRKSTALETLAGKPYFTDRLTAHADLNSREVAELIQGPWFVEMGELDALSKTEATSTKTFFSATTDRYRAPYAKLPEDRPRRCVFAGTTNEDSYLRDPTGGRRFWPIACREIDLEGIVRDRDQLWAEAVARYRDGETWWLEDPAIVAAAREETDARYSADGWEPMIEKFIGGRQNVSLEDVLFQGIGIEKKKLTQADQNRVARALKRLGWEKYRDNEANGRRPWRYRSANSAGSTK
jgi:predicted P-loop ATPase